MSDNAKPPEELPDSIPECHKALDELRKTVADLQTQLEWLRKQVFAPKSEKMPASNPQQSEIFTDSDKAPAFDWKFTKDDLKAPMHRLDAKVMMPVAA